MTEAKIQVIEAQARYTPHRLPEIEKARNRREQVWNPEIDTRMKLLWDTLSDAFSTKFGVTPMPYSTELFLVQDHFAEGHTTMGKAFLESGHISLAETLLTSKENAKILPQVLAHEMAHFYSHRRYLETTRSGLKRGRPVQFGLTFGKDLEPDYFNDFNEALTEITGTDVLNSCADNIPDIVGKRFEPMTYDYQRKLFSLLLRGLELGASKAESSSPLYGLKKEDIFRLFQQISWGNKEDAKKARASIRILGNLAYSDNWNTLVRATTHRHKEALLWMVYYPLLQENINNLPKTAEFSLPDGQSIRMPLDAVKGVPWEKFEGGAYIGRDHFGLAKLIELASEDLAHPKSLPELIEILDSRKFSATFVSHYERHHNSDPGFLSVSREGGTSSFPADAVIQKLNAVVVELIKNNLVEPSGEVEFQGDLPEFLQSTTLYPLRDVSDVYLVQFESISGATAYAFVDMNM